VAVVRRPGPRRARRSAEALNRTARRAFLLLVAAQAAHSVEEIVFRLYEVFPPARWVSGLVSDDLRRGFILANAALVLFGLVCHVVWVRRPGPAGPRAAWGWLIVETANGTVHLLLAAARGGYFPGAATAPLLLAASAWLASGLRRARPD
jgi:hypothetical protein